MRRNHSLSDVRESNVINEIGVAHQMGISVNRFRTVIMDDLACEMTLLNFEMREAGRWPPAVTRWLAMNGWRNDDDKSSSPFDYVESRHTQGRCTPGRSYRRGGASIKRVAAGLK